VESIRTVYRCIYVHTESFPAGPAWDSRAFKTEQEARGHADALKALSFCAIIGRMRWVNSSYISNHPGIGRVAWPPPGARTRRNPAATN